MSPASPADPAAPGADANGRTGSGGGRAAGSSPAGPPLVVGGGAGRGAVFLRHRLDAPARKPLPPPSSPAIAAERGPRPWPPAGLRSDPTLRATCSPC